MFNNKERGVVQTERPRERIISLLSSVRDLDVHFRSELVSSKLGLGRTGLAFRLVFHKGNALLGRNHAHLAETRETGELVDNLLLSNRFGQVLQKENVVWRKILVRNALQVPCGCYIPPNTPASVSCYIYSFFLFLTRLGTRILELRLVSARQRQVLASLYIRMTRHIEQSKG